MANIWIEGHGVFTVNNDKVQELIGWLANNQAVQAEGTSSEFDGQKLLNETGEQVVVPKQGEGKPVPTSNPQANPKSDGSGTYEFGGTWM